MNQLVNPKAVHAPLGAYTHSIKVPRDAVDRVTVLNFGLRDASSATKDLAVQIPAVKFRWPASRIGAAQPDREIVTATRPAEWGR